MDKKDIVLRAINDLGNLTHLKKILISTCPIGLMGQIGTVELITDSRGTHIGVRDICRILGDEEEFLCRCYNKLLKTIFEILESLISEKKVMFMECNYMDQKGFSEFFLEVGSLDKWNQEFYDKYTKGIFVKL